MGRHAQPPGPPPDGSVSTVKVQDDAITTAKLADDAVIFSKLIDSAVQTDKIQDGAVSTSKIADDAVTADKLASDAVVDLSVAVGAGIQRTKTASGTANAVMVNDGSGVMSEVAPGADDTVLTMVSGAPAFAAAGGGGDYDTGLSWFRESNPSGTTLEIWDTAVRTSAISTSQGAIAGRLYAVQFHGGLGGVIKAFRVRTNNTGGKFRVGVYSSKANREYYPDALLFDSGEQTSTGTGVELLMSGLLLAIDAGTRYWLAVIADSSAHYFCDTQVGTIYGPVANATTATSTVIVRLSSTYGALPATFPAGATGSGSPQTMPKAVWQWSSYG